MRRSVALISPASPSATASKVVTAVRSGVRATCRAACRGPGCDIADFRSHHRPPRPDQTPAWSRAAYDEHIRWCGGPTEGPDRPHAGGRRAGRRAPRPARKVRTDAPTAAHGRSAAPSGRSGVLRDVSDLPAQPRPLRGIRRAEQARAKRPGCSEVSGPSRPSPSSHRSGHELRLISRLVTTRIGDVATTPEHSTPCEVVPLVGRRGRGCPPRAPGHAARHPTRAPARAQRADLDPQRARRRQQLHYPSCALRPVRPRWGESRAGPTGPRWRAAYGWPPATRMRPPGVRYARSFPLSAARRMVSRGSPVRAAPVLV